MAVSKARPPIHPEYSESGKSTRILSSLTEVEIRRYLRAGPNNYPHFLYKYSSNIEHIKCLLLDSDFYLSSCISFNDPFDTTAQIILDDDVLNLRKRFDEILKNKSPTLNYKKRQQEVTNMVIKYKADPESVLRIFNKNTQNNGVFCLTEDPRNILMWSHYANKHEGVVLQFDISKDPESLLYALKMHYSKEYPIFNLKHSFDTYFESIILRKAIDWEYEKEWRILRVGGANTYQQFKPQALVGLIFGCRVKEDFKRKIMSILEERKNINHPDIKIYTSIMHKSEYAVQIKKL
jgi:hypothetical protein